LVFLAGDLSLAVEMTEENVEMTEEKIEMTEEKIENSSIAAGFWQEHHTYVIQ
jgi:hypothetical protein